MHPILPAIAPSVPPAVAERLENPPGASTPAVPPAALYLSRLADGSRRTMLSALERVLEVLTGERLDPLQFPWSRLRYEHTCYVRAQLAQRYSPAHANKCLAALRGVLRECWRLGQLSREDFERAVDFHQVRGTSLPRGRALSQRELATLIAACHRPGGPGGLRDAALVAVLYGGGLRRAEVVSLDLSDLVLDTGELTVRRGKGRKARRVFLSLDVIEHLSRWLEVRGSEPGALFVRVLRGGHVRLARLSDQTVFDVLRRRSREAGLEAVAPHDLRRTTATRLLEGGADLSLVRDLLGHQSVITTSSRYDLRGDGAKRRASALLTLPRELPAPVVASA